MNREGQSETTGNLPEQADQQAIGTPAPIAVKDGDAYYGLLPRHYLCANHHAYGQLISADEPDIARKYCKGCGRSLLPWPASGLVAVGDQVILRSQTDRMLFGFAREVLPWETCQGVRVWWAQTKSYQWIESDLLMQFSEWEKENPAPSVRNFWHASASEQASIRGRAGRYWE